VAVRALIATGYLTVGQQWTDVGCALAPPAVTRFTLERNGAVFVRVDRGNMGCYGNGSGVVKPRGAS
jgi:hypothetical protein